MQWLERVAFFSMYIEYRHLHISQNKVALSIPAHPASDLPLEVLQLCYIEARVPPNINQDFDTPFKLKQRL